MNGNASFNIALEDSLQARVEELRAMFGAPSNAPGVDAQGDLERALHAAKIAIIDDQPLNIKIVERYLKQAGYQEFVTTSDSRQAMGMIAEARPDVVLLDVMMPHVSGLDILGELRRTNDFADLPVVILTAASDAQTKLDAFRGGAAEFLQKPIDAIEMQLRLRNVLLARLQRCRLKKYTWELEAEVARRSADLARAHQEVVECLARVGEFRDNETGLHIIRVGRYAEVLATHLGFGEELATRIRHAAPLHDIGKVAIPDSILLKPGALDNLEFARMKRHCEYGVAICAQSTGLAIEDLLTHTAVGRTIVEATNSPILRMAAIIAFSHHERWDGTGYPAGLRGEAIPQEGRITAVADVFDALTQERPYKPAFPLEKSLGIIRDQSGRQFDPAVVEAMFAGLEPILAVYYEYADRRREAPALDAVADPSCVSAAISLPSPAQSAAEALDTIHPKG